MIEHKDIQLGRKYWVVDEYAQIGKEVFQYEFEFMDEWVDKWDWAVFESEADARGYARYLPR